MTHHLRRDCNHDCTDCELADERTCLEFALMTADKPEAVRFCRDCDVKAWHADLLIRDGDGAEIQRRYWECPRCHRMWVDGVDTPYNGTY